MITKVHPVIIPDLCSRLCQFNFSTPLYANLTHNTIPETDIKRYSEATLMTAHMPFVPAKRKYASISIQGEKNIAATKANMIFFLASEGI